MKDNIIALFSGIENEKRKELFALMQTWEKTISSSKIVFKDDNKEYNGNEYFYYDGFFPGYYENKPKVLFIGREARYVGGLDFISETINYFKNIPTLNNVSFWRRILCMYNIIRNKGVIDENITADQIVELMIEKNDYGFAVMNISKYSNDSDTGARRDAVLMNRFIEDSKLDQRNFIKEEIEILDPDLIITANLWDGSINNEYMEKFFGELKFITKVTYQSDWVAALNNYNLGNKIIKLIDLYHFSRPGVIDMEYYYKPISKLFVELDK
jgi:hypothetical protein